MRRKNETKTKQTCHTWDAMLMNISEVSQPTLVCSKQTNQCRVFSITIAVKRCCDVRMKRWRCVVSLTLWTLNSMLVSTCAIYHHLLVPLFAIHLRNSKDNKPFNFGSCGESFLNLQLRPIFAPNKPSLFSL